jgi:four helix bundle protein
MARPLSTARFFMQCESTLIYQRALTLVALIRQVIERLPAGYGFLADQMRRAVASVALNFSEGYGKSTSADQRRFFRIARGSAYEVAAALDVARSFGVVTAELHAQGKDLCDHIAAMLTRFRNPVRR